MSVSMLPGSRSTWVYIDGESLLLTRVYGSGDNAVTNISPRHFGREDHVPLKQDWTNCEEHGSLYPHVYFEHNMIPGYAVALQDRL